MIPYEQEEDPELQVEVDEPKYWADADDPDELVASIKDRVRDYYNSLNSAGFIELWSSAHAHMYSLGPQGHEGSKIIGFGDDGEKLGIKANHLRSIARYILNATTTDKVVIKPKAKNASALARAQVPTTNRVLDHYHYTKRYHRILIKVALRTLIYAKGYLWQFWDPSTEEGGELVYKACSPLEVAVDLDREDGDHDWYVIRVPRNKYDLAALKPELADQIIGMDLSDLDADLEKRIQFGFRRDKTSRDSDLVYEYHFMHRKTPALPEGRYTIVVGDLVRFDGPLPYKTIPISSMVPEEFAEFGDVGYSSIWDLIALQDYYDALTSTGMTNMDALGHNDVLLPEGVELGVEEIRDGLNVIRYPAGEFNKPSILEKFSLREEFFKLRDATRTDMEMISGANQVARGQPEASLKSGSALALVEAQAIKFQSGMLSSFADLVADSSSKTVEILAAFCPEERIKEIAGANDPDGLTAFSGGKLNLISQVECEKINPIFNTLGGRQEAANNLLERGMLDTVQYIAMIETGRPEVVTEAPLKESTYYQHVREVLMTGPAVQETVDELTGTLRMFVPDLPITIMDNPQAGIKAAQDVMWSIELRQDQNVVKACTAFAQETIRVWKLAPLDMLAALGYPPAPSMAPMPEPAPGKPGEKPAPGGKPGAPKPPAQGTQDVSKSPAKGSGMPSLPSPAKSPNEAIT